MCTSEEKDLTTLFVISSSLFLFVQTQPPSTLLYPIYKGMDPSLIPPVQGRRARKNCDEAARRGRVFVLLRALLIVPLILCSRSRALAVCHPSRLIFALYYTVSRKEYIFSTQDYALVLVHPFPSTPRKF
ncbi:hypothetical protein DFS33DRAFT_1288559 [Desarmillaria ectypa]|nr:hypothetical protein DFS33DRAFT_1288559 [Desarmillaria ectypa]